MSKNSIKQAALAVLSKSKTLDEATQNFSTEELRELETLVKAINKKTGDGRYGKPNPDVEMKEVLKTDKQGQWKIEKAIKPGPTLNYKKINPKPNFKDMEEKAPTIDYKGGAVGTKPEWSGAADRAKDVRTKLETESNETAAETIARRQKMNKDDPSNGMASAMRGAFGGGGSAPAPAPAASSSGGSLGSNISGAVGRAMGKGDGTLVDKELSASKKSRMVAKEESEPHKDDPDHEAKEKKKAKKIKDEAEDLLGMHKKEKDTTGMLIGKQRKKRTVSWGPGV